MRLTVTTWTNQRSRRQLTTVQWLGRGLGVLLTGFWRLLLLAVVFSASALLVAVLLAALGPAVSSLVFVLVIVIIVLLSLIVLRHRITSKHML